MRVEGVMLMMVAGLSIDTNNAENAGRKVLIANAVKPLPNPPLIKGGHSTVPFSRTNKPAKSKLLVRDRSFRSLLPLLHTRVRLPSLIREGLGMGLTVAQSIDDLILVEVVDGV
uniref:Uncharacterized protein n=1 Tax=uncultured Thiotrichaceae bacterium TaxID=298394 RepID=A0A6S6TYW2_9GAMM|nr:MAG: Unknown protein [uncultured Thiotrichaceae bacterium]